MYILDKGEEKEFDYIYLAATFLILNGSSLIACNHNFCWIFTNFLHLWIFKKIKIYKQQAFSPKICLCNTILPRSKNYIGPVWLSFHNSTMKFDHPLKVSNKSSLQNQFQNSCARNPNESNEATKTVYKTNSKTPALGTLTNLMRPLTAWLEDDYWL